MCKDAFIVCCNAAALTMYQLLIYHSSTQYTAPQVHFLAVLQCRSRRRPEIRPVQLTATQLQWTMKAASESIHTHFVHSISNSVVDHIDIVSIDALVFCNGKKFNIILWKSHYCNEGSRILILDKNGYQISTI